MSYSSRLIYLFLILSFNLFSLDDQSVYLKNNLEKARPGDYIVTSACKNLTVMHIYSNENQRLVVEEISVPQKYKPRDWKAWIEAHAPGHTQWVMYELDLNSGKRTNSYSFSKGYWFELSEMDDFFSKLLHLKFQKIPLSERKFVGPKPKSGPDFRALWQPPVIVDGQPVRGVLFDAWRTRWPQDQTDLSGKVIEIYLPQKNQNYPSYFPYWLQINGAMGKAKIRIVDSGSHLKSPKPALYDIKN